ncbi:MAG: hypothetical protein ABH811_01890 [archaeon]
MKNKRGLSVVISIMIIILLVLVLVGVVWGIVNNMVEKSLNEAGSCFGIYDEVTLNNQYTCYDGDEEEVQFSINVGDVELDELLVSIVSQGDSKTFIIPKELSLITNLGPFPTGSGSVKVPGNHSGRTYVATGFTFKPTSIEIVPTVNGEMCKVSDIIYEVDNCKDLGL